jgi:UDP-N-acetyl-D-mannosaminuronic acid dehydrogenase
VDIVKELERAQVGELLVVEPHLLFHPEFELTPVEQALQRANIVLVLVDHKAFKRIRREALHEKLLVDTRGLFL